MAVPIMFHSVGLASHSWSFPWLSEDLKTFEAKMSALKSHFYRTVWFKDLTFPIQYNERAVALTFDDGYLDNWVHVFPILQRYEFKATIFPSVEFIDPDNVVRPTSQLQSGGQHHVAEQCCAGFLCWEEMRRMEESGLIDIQSHGLTHTWHFKGPRIVDFWHPGCATRPGGPIWMLWNRFPESKPYYLLRAHEIEAQIAYGTPIYEYGRALTTRRYLPGERLTEVLTRYVDERGVSSFFQDGNWQDELHQVAHAHRDRQVEDGDGYESESEYLQRVQHELAKSKQVLEYELGKDIEAFCWPGGGMTKRGLEMARKLGYRRFTLPSEWNHLEGSEGYTDLISRISGCSHLSYKGRDLGAATSREFIWFVKRASGSAWYRWLSRGAWMSRLASSYVTTRE